MRNAAARLYSLSLEVVARREATDQFRQFQLTRQLLD